MKCARILQAIWQQCQAMELRELLSSLFFLPLRENFAFGTPTSSEANCRDYSH